MLQDSKQALGWSFESYTSTQEPLYTPFDRRSTMQPFLADISDRGRLLPSLRIGLIYLLSTAITSGVVICIMLTVMGDPGYKYTHESCTCDCFDRRFKGTHFDSIDQYRHVYFNATSNTALLFIWSTLHLALLLAFVHRALLCLLATLRRRSFDRPGSLRWRILVCACVNFYGLVYGWWVMFNYINDAWHWSRMGVLWPTQLFFSLTDLAPAYAGYCLLATGPLPSYNILQSALVISCVHILLALWDQGAVHLLTLHPLASRDFMFLVSDIAGVVMVAPYVKVRNEDNSRRLWSGALLSIFYLVLKAFSGSF